MDGDLSRYGSFGGLIAESTRRVDIDRAVESTLNQPTARSAVAVAAVVASAAARRPARSIDAPPRQRSPS